MSPDFFVVVVVIFIGVGVPQTLVLKSEIRDFEEFLVTQMEMEILLNKVLWVLLEKAAGSSLCSTGPE